VGEMSGVVDPFSSHWEAGQVDIHIVSLGKIFIPDPPESPLSFCVFPNMQISTVKKFANTPYTFSAKNNLRIQKVRIGLRGLVLTVFERDRLGQRGGF
jgi:hypothetical protein